MIILFFLTGFSVDGQNGFILHGNDRFSKVGTPKNALSILVFMLGFYEPLVNALPPFPLLLTVFPASYARRFFLTFVVTLLFGTL